MISSFAACEEVSGITLDYTDSEIEPAFQRANSRKPEIRELMLPDMMKERQKT